MTARGEGSPLAREEGRTRQGELEGGTAESTFLDPEARTASTPPRSGIRIIDDLFKGQVRVRTREKIGCTQYWTSCRTRLKPDIMVAS